MHVITVGNDVAIPVLAGLPVGRHDRLVFDSNADELRCTLSEHQVYRAFRYLCPHAGVLDHQERLGLNGSIDLRGDRPKVCHNKV
jgi:hypothetical protein